MQSFVSLFTDIFVQNNINSSFYISFWHKIIEFMALTDSFDWFKLGASAISELVQFANIIRTQDVKFIHIHIYSVYICICLHFPSNADYHRQVKTPLQVFCISIHLQLIQWICAAHRDCYGQRLCSLKNVIT